MLHHLYSGLTELLRPDRQLSLKSRSPLFPSDNSLPLVPRSPLHTPKLLSQPTLASHCLLKQLQLGGPFLLALFQSLPRLPQLLRQLPFALGSLRSWTPCNRSSSSATRFIHAAR